MAKSLELISKNRKKYDVATRKVKTTPKKKENASPGKVGDYTFGHSFWDHAKAKMNDHRKTPNITKSRPQKRCEFCAEFNHQTRECGFRSPVNCRQCQCAGHKQKFCSEFLSFSR